MAWLLRKPPLPCHRGGGNHLAGWGGGVGVPAHIYIYISVCVIEGIQLLTISWLADIVPFPDRRSLDNRAASLPNPQGWGMDGWNTEFVREWGIAP